MKLRLFIMLSFLSLGFALLMPAKSVSAASSGTVSVTVQIIPPDGYEESQKQILDDKHEFAELILQASKLVHETSTKATGLNHYQTET